MKYILFAILIYLAYQFIFNLVVPVYKTTSKIKKGFREMNTRMEEQMKQQPGYRPQPASESPAPKKPSGDYIDFEEIK